MSVSCIRLTRNICNIQINRPDKRNALNLDLVKQLRRALDNFEQDDQFSIAILSGVGGHFCAGYDLNDVIDVGTGMPDLTRVEQMLWPLGNSLSDNKMVIAAIEGHAVGFGFELALKCDFRVAERDARMGFLNRRFGVPIMNGGTVMLPQLIGQSRAAELVATGKAQLAPQALEYGLLSFVPDIGCAMGQSLNLARSMAKFRQNALLHDLNHIRHKQDKQLWAMLQRERQDSLEYLKNCGPLDVASKFLRGTLCRHGSTDMGNLDNQTPEMSL